MRIIAEDTVALVIDVQEKLLPHIFENETIKRNIGILIEGLNFLGIDVLVTEQYRKGLGETVSELKQKIRNYTPMEKMTFSCCDDSAIQNILTQCEKKNVIVCGIEAHVCVLQTTIDLIEKGFTPIVIEDCTSSRKANDKSVALIRMQQEGALISSYEAVLFELARISGTEQFKAISRLVK
jgi:nicotinamidase-related amidase